MKPPVARWPPEASGHFGSATARAADAPAAGVHGNEEAFTWPPDARLTPPDPHDRLLWPADRSGISMSIAVVAALTRRSNG